MPSILLVRHAQASFGTANYDVLSARGRRQAELLGEALARRGARADRLVSGDLRRQTETAAAVPLAADGETAIDRSWNEYETDKILAAHSISSVRLDTPPSGDQGTVDNREFQRLLDAALEGWVAAGEDSPCEFTYPRFAARVGAALDFAFDQLGPGETAVVVSSGGVIAATCAALLGCTESAFVPLSRVQVNTGISKLLRGRSGTSLASFNDHSHLEAAGRSLVTYR